MTTEVTVRDMAISPFLSGQTEKREIASRARLFVIARNVAISVVRGWPKDKREIASQARNDIINRAALASMCHREERRDLAFTQPANG